MAYFSNATEGSILDQQCGKCPLGAEGIPCPTLFIQHVFNYEQLDKGNERLRDAMNALVDEKGNCLTYLELDKLELKQNIPVSPDTSPVTLDLFMEWAKDRSTEFDLETMDDDIFGHAYFVDIDTKNVFEAFHAGLIAGGFKNA